MKRLYRATGFAIALGVASLAGGCVPPQTTITSSSDKSYVKEPKRIMAVETVGDELGQYHATFKATLAQRLQECGATVDFMTRPPVDPLALDDSAAVVQRQQEQVAIRQMSADTVLEIVQVSVYRTQEIPPIVRDIGYRLQLDDVQTGKPFWRGDVKLFTAFDLVTVHDAGAAFANDLMNKLIQDGIFHSCAAAEQH